MNWSNLRIFLQKNKQCVLIISFLDHPFNFQTKTWKYTGWPQKNRTVDTVDFSGLCSDQKLSFFTFRGTINDSFSNKYVLVPAFNQLQRNLSAKWRAWIVNPC